jgi:hypothetical protein
MRDDTALNGVCAPPARHTAAHPCRTDVDAYFGAFSDERDVHSNTHAFSVPLMPTDADTVACPAGNGVLVAFTV